MSYKAVFAGNNLHDYFKILKINRTILPPKSVFTRDIPSLHGQVYTGFKYTPRVYTLECVLNAQDNEDLVDKIKTISHILDTKSPSKLILGDSSDRYNYAIVTNEIDLEKFKYNGKFNIEFTCLDPISYSNEYEEFYGNNDSIVTVNNGGNTEAYPKTSIVFNENANFLQCTNYLKETILIGTPQKADTETIFYNPIVLKDNCEVLTGWNSVSNVLDAGREITGNLVVNDGGYGFTLGSYTPGTNNKWYGGALRKSLGQNVQDFRVEIKLEHNSYATPYKNIKVMSDENEEISMKNNSSIEKSSKVRYTVTADPILRVREGRGNTYPILGCYKKDDVINITNIHKNWGEVIYNGKIGYVHMDYILIEPIQEETQDVSINYKITSSVGTILRSGTGTNYTKLIVIPYGEIVTVKEIKNGWGKTTYSNKVGWFPLQYAIQQSSSKTITMDEGSSGENKLGLIEIYGFDQNGNKLFKCKMIDNQKWYEYSEPEIEFGSHLILEDKRNCPAPKTITIADNNNKTVKQEVDSGKYGDWNDMYGWFTVERRTVNGQHRWYAMVEKLGVNGKVIQSIYTQTISGNFPTGALNNIVIFIGGYNEEPLVNEMNVNEVYVTNLSKPSESNKVVPLFYAGDELVIDHQSQKIYRNGKPIMEKLDIGSQFFSVPVGSSQFICKSDANDINIISSIQKRWL